MDYDFEKLLRDPRGFRVLLSPRPDKQTQVQIRVGDKTGEAVRSPHELAGLLSDLVSALGGPSMGEFDFEEFAKGKRDELKSIDSEMERLAQRRRRLYAELKIVDRACASLDEIDNKKPRQPRTPKSGPKPVILDRVVEMLSGGKDLTGEEIAEKLGDVKVAGVKILLSRAANKGNKIGRGKRGFVLLKAV